MSRGGPGGGMPTEAWLFACGFRVVIGKLLRLELPTGTPAAPVAGTCEVLISEGVQVAFEVDFHTAIIGMHPAGVAAAPHPTPGVPLYHIGELVQVNLRAREPAALSIERYFSNVMHMGNTQDE